MRSDGDEAELDVRLLARLRREVRRVQRNIDQRRAERGRLVDERDRAARDRELVERSGPRLRLGRRGRRSRRLRAGRPQGPTRTRARRAPTIRRQGASHRRSAHRWTAMRSVHRVRTRGCGRARQQRARLQPASEPSRRLSASPSTCASPLSSSLRSAGGPSTKTTLSRVVSAPPATSTRGFCGRYAT